VSRPAVLDDPDRWFAAMAVVTALTTARLNGIDIDQRELLDESEASRDDVVSALVENLARIFESFAEPRQQDLLRWWGLTVACKGGNV
jgi:hypothetical protein